MSSIYKKGRDGYFYYQTYVYNPETKKKDKRIFHALSTKNPQEAKKKQLELDSKYSKGQIESKKNRYSFFYFPGKLLLKFCFTIFIIFVLIGYLMREKKVSKKDIVVEMSQIEKVIKQNKQLPQELEPAKNLENDSSGLEIAQPKIIIDQKLKKEKVSIPKFKIERVEKTLDAFEQGKVYVTIEEETKSDSQMLLCDSLANRFTNFANIVICLYANNKIGQKLAKGEDKSVSIEDQKRFWLAMYTYNSVEGKYFDSDPSSFLGVY